MNPTERFRELTARPDESIPLDEAALCIAAHRYPDLDIDAQRARLDDLAAGCPAPTLDALRSHLFTTVGFIGDSTDYYDARNSFLNDVLDRRTGLPIALAVLTMEVGRRRGVALQGIGMPGHFLVGTVPERAAGPVTYVDVFAGGVILDDAGCSEVFARLQPGVPFDPGFLAPVGPRAILNRMLANLQGVFFSSDLDAARWVVELRRAIPDRQPVDHRGLAQALAALGRFDAAADELDAVGLEREARMLRARTN